MERMGSLLERITATLFERAGFYVKKNIRIKGYEIDVVASKYGRTIICECKQYTQSSLTIRNIIHQWDSKNNEIKADKVVIVLYGLQPSEEDYKLARKYNISILTYENIQWYLKKKDKKLSKKIIGDLGLGKRNWIVRIYKFNKQRKRGY